MEEGRIAIKDGKNTLSTPLGHPTMIAIRQPEFDIEATVELGGEIKEGQISGLSAFYNNDYHYDIFITRDKDGYKVCLRKRVADIEVITKSQPIDYNGSAKLKIIANDQWYMFLYENNGEFTELGRGAVSLLATEVNGRSFTGTFIGIFCEQGDIYAKSFSLKAL